jgi:hypothetical protein
VRVLSGRGGTTGGMVNDSVCLGFWCIRLLSMVLLVLLTVSWCIKTQGIQNHLPYHQ